MIRPTQPTDNATHLPLGVMIIEAAALAWLCLAIYVVQVIL